MNFKEYQIESRKTAQYKNAGNNWIYPALGLAGESGEVIEYLKKTMRTETEEITEDTKEKLKKELGDVLWYVAQLCTELGFTLDDVAQTNIEKLQARIKEMPGYYKGIKN